MWVIGALILAGVYYLSRYFQENKSSNIQRKTENYTDVLLDEKYKVKGQWEK